MENKPRCLFLVKVLFCYIFLRKGESGVGGLYSEELINGKNLHFKKSYWVSRNCKFFKILCQKPVNDLDVAVFNRANRQFEWSRKVDFQQKNYPMWHFISYGIYSLTLQKLVLESKVTMFTCTVIQLARNSPAIWSRRTLTAKAEMWLWWKWSPKAWGTC